MNDCCLKFIPVGTGVDLRKIAVRERAGSSPGILWLGGFKSDMKGTKAAALDAWAQAQGRAIIRFDYSGHGESGGEFADGTIGRWLEDCLAVFEACCRGPQIVVGSSMGGWLALLLVRSLAQRAVARATIAGLVLIAPAVDFTEELMWKRFPPDIKRAVEETGGWARPSAYGDEPYLITRKLIEEGRNHLLLDKKLALPCPVRLLHGQGDPDVPWEYSLQIARHLEAPEVVTTLVKGGDHRLSTPADIARLIATVEELTG